MRRFVKAIALDSETGRVSLQVVSSEQDDLDFDGEHAGTTCGSDPISQTKLRGNCSRCDSQQCQKFGRCG